MGHAKKIYIYSHVPPYVHFVAKFPSFAGAKLLSLSTHPPVYSFPRIPRLQERVQSVAL